MQLIARLNLVCMALSMLCISLLGAGVQAVGLVEGTVRIVHPYSVGSPVHARLMELVPEMEATADYSTRFEVYSADDLAEFNSYVFGIFSGEYDFVFGPATLFASQYTDVGFLSRSDVFWSSEQWKKFRGSPAEALVAELFERGELDLVDSAWIGAEHLITTKDIHGMDDLVGMRVGASGPKSGHVEALAALGADPISVTWFERFYGLQDGDLDAMVGPIAWMSTEAVPTASRTIIGNPVGGHVGWLVGRRDWPQGMDTFTAEQVRIAMSKAMLGLGTEIEDLERAKIQLLEDAGVEVTVLEESEMKFLHDAMRDSWRMNLNDAHWKIANLIGGP